MSSTGIELSADLATTLFYVGDEKTCVIVCDNVLQDPDVVRDAADNIEQFVSVDPSVGGNDNISTGTGNDVVLAGFADDIVDTGDDHDF